MAGYRSVLAVISVYILVCLSGLGDCRNSLQAAQDLEGSDQTNVGEKEQSVHLVLPSEKEKEKGTVALPIVWKEVPVETQTLDLRWDLHGRPNFRGKDGIFVGERSRRFRFGRPGGCHQGNFKRPFMQNREGKPMEFTTLTPSVSTTIDVLPVQSESRELGFQFHPLPEREGEFWSHPREGGFANIEGWQPRHRQEEEGEKVGPWMIMEWLKRSMFRGH